jgi:hypothetical protein
MQLMLQETAHQIDKSRYSASIASMKPSFFEIGVGELCKRLKVPYRQVRYVLEEGIVPKGVEEAPNRGHHRTLNPQQAFWLGIVVKLKQTGVKTPLAAEIANLAERGVRDLSQNDGWDWTFHPFQGRLKTENQWYVDIGDLKYVRVASDARDPERGLVEQPWVHIRARREADVDPVAIIRLNLSRLAQLLDHESL